MSLTEDVGVRALQAPIKWLACDYHFVMVDIPSTLQNVPVKIANVLKFL